MNEIPLNWTLTQLRYAEAVFRLGSFSAAARELRVSQPTVSNGVALLEDTLGAPLFERSTRRLSPTTFGTTLERRMVEVLAVAHELSRSAEIALDPTHKLLRVGFSPLVGQKRVHALAEAFLDATPDVEVVYKECQIGMLVDRLDEESIDIAFTIVEGRPRRLQRCVVHREPMRVVPRGEGLVTVGGIDIESLGSERMLLTMGVCGLARATRALFADAGVHLDAYRGEALSPGVIREWAELGMGTAIIPDGHLDDPARYPELRADGKRVEITYEAVWRRATRAAHLVAFIQHIKKRARALSRGGALRSA